MSHCHKILHKKKLISFVYVIEGEAGKPVRMTFCLPLYAC